MSDSHIVDGIKIAHHFESPSQQYDAAKFGMWLFIAQEVLFFSGLFLAYAVFRYFYPETFLHAHEFLSVPLGAFNTVILLTSSLTMALAVRAAQTSHQKQLVIQLGFTFLLATGFLVVKYFEYTHKFHMGIYPGKYYTFEGIKDGYPHIFFGIYYVLTGLHGLHVLIGMGLIAWIWMKGLRGEFHSKNFTTVENVGLYWHLVDMVWIFLFPLLYLVR